MKPKEVVEVHKKAFQGNWDERNTNSKLEEEQLVSQQLAILD